MKHDQASHTARFVSNGIYWVSQHRRLRVEVPDVLARYTAEMTRCLEIRRSRLGSGGARRLLLARAALMQACSIPGIYLHQLLRKRYIESLVREALDGTTTQLVVIGAGFDTLGVRISNDLPGHHVIEVDHPATQQMKRMVLEEFELPVGDCHFLPADLSGETLDSALARCPGYDSSRSTVFIAEGITMYLDESSIRELLHYVAGQGRDSELIFTYMEESAPGRYDFQNARLATSLWLALRNERFTWGIRKDELARFLSESGLSLREHRTPEELRVELLAESNRDAVLARGENTARAVN